MTGSLSARLLQAHTRWWRFVLLIWPWLINKLVIVLGEPAQEVMSPPPPLLQANASLDGSNLLSTRFMADCITKDYLLMSVPRVGTRDEGLQLHCSALRINGLFDNMCDPKGP